MKSKACSQVLHVLAEYATQEHQLRRQEAECRSAYVEGELLELRLRRIHEEKRVLAEGLSLALEQAFAAIFSVGYERAAQLPEQEGALVVPYLREKVMRISLQLDRILLFPNSFPMAVTAACAEILQDLDEYVAGLEGGSVTLAG